MTFRWRRCRVMRRRIGKGPENRYSLIAIKSKYEEMKAYALSKYIDCITEEVTIARKKGGHTIVTVKLHDKREFM